MCSPPPYFVTMDLASVIVECHARECALMVELEAAKVARVEAEGAKREALAEKEAANREKEAVTREKDLLRRENETLRTSTGTVEEAVQRALAAQKERIEKEAAEAQYRREQRSIWLRSPEAVLSVLCITAQNGYSAQGFKNLSREFRYDEQLWDAIKDRRGPKGWTYLMVAAKEGDVERVQWLLKRSANVNALLVENGSTALMGASDKGHLEIARMLIDKGANVNTARTDNGMTALMFSSWKGHLEVAQLMIDKGANLNAARTNDGMTALIMACLDEGHLALVNLLLSKGADDKLCTAKGSTALQLAKNPAIRSALM